MDRGYWSTVKIISTFQRFNHTCCILQYRAALPGYLSAVFHRKSTLQMEKGNTGTGIFTQVGICVTHASTDTQQIILNIPAILF